MSFKLINTNRFFLEGTNERFVHLATVHHSLREYMCFADTWRGDIYIEEITGGTGPARIEDDALALGLQQFLEYKGVLDVAKPTLPDSHWLRAGKTQ